MNDLIVRSYNVIICVICSGIYPIFKLLSFIVFYSVLDYMIDLVLRTIRQSSCLIFGSLNLNRLAFTVHERQLGRRTNSGGSDEP